MDITDHLGSALRHGWGWAATTVTSARGRTGVQGPPPCKALVLDIDDTLIDTEATIRSAAQTAALEIWPGSTTAARESFADHFHTDAAGVFAQYTRGDLRYHEMRKMRIGAAALAAGMQWEPRRYRRFCEAYDPAFAAGQRLHRDAMPAVDAAEKWGISIVLLTNSSDAATRMKLQVLGVAQRFPAVITTDTFGFGKPDPRVFEYACELVGAAPADCVAIGDSYRNDVAAARTAGLRALWLDRSGTGVGGEPPAIRSLAGLTAALTHAV